MTDQSTFIKSATTMTPVSKTRADIMEMIDRYGGSGFGYETIGDDIIVRFSVPGIQGRPLRVAYPVNIKRVLDRLVPHLKRLNKRAPTRENAERVAWRNIYELVDAAFAAAAIGASTVEEAFHAHIVIRTPDGNEGRMYDYIESLRAFNDGQLPTWEQVQGKLLSGSKR